MTGNHNMTPNAPETPTRPRTRFSPTRAVLVIVLTAVIAGSNIIMIGPLAFAIVLVAPLVGILFALQRSFWSLVCFGYPFTFALTQAAWIVYTQLRDYGRINKPFVGCVGFGLVGCVLIAVGLWKALPSTDKTETGVSFSRSTPCK